MGTVDLSLSTLILTHLPVGSAAPSLSATLGGSGSTGLGVFWASGNGPQAQSVTAGNIYRLRWTLSSTDASTASHSTIRVRQGDVNKIGSSEDVINPPLGPTSSASFRYNTWFIPKAAGTMPFAFDVYDFTATTSIAAAVESVSINSTTRAQLTTAGTRAVVKNLGNPTLTTFSGEPTPEASTVSAFPSASTNLNFADLVGTSRPLTTTPASTSVTFTVSPRVSPNTDETFSLYNYGDVTAGNGFVNLAAGNTLVLTDFWISAPGGSSDALPPVRFAWNTAASVGVSSLAYFGGQATQNGNGGAANGQAFQTTSRMYSSAFQPQVGSGTVPYRLETNVLVFDNTAGAPRPIGYQGTVRFDRITVTQFTGLPSLN